MSKLRRVICGHSKNINFVWRSCVLGKGHKGKHTDGQGRFWGDN